MSSVFLPPIVITPTRELTAQDIAQVQALRGTRHYPDPYDSRYARSGLHLSFTDEALRAKHESDPESRYYLARSPSGELQGYMRSSVLRPLEQCSDTRLEAIGALLSSELRREPVLFVAVVVVAVHVEGRYLKIQGEPRDSKLAEVLYHRVLLEGQKLGCRVAVADVYVSPHANSRSLAFHHRLGFRSLGYPLLIDSLDGVEIHSLRLARAILPLHSLERRADGLWHDTSKVPLRHRE